MSEDVGPPEERVNARGYYSKQYEEFMSKYHQQCDDWEEYSRDLVREQAKGDGGDGPVPQNLLATNPVMPPDHRDPRAGYKARLRPDYAGMKILSDIFTRHSKALPTVPVQDIFPGREIFLGSDQELCGLHVQAEVRCGVWVDPNVSSGIQEVHCSLKLLNGIWFLKAYEETKHERRVQGELTVSVLCENDDPMPLRHEDTFWVGQYLKIVFEQN